MITARAIGSDGTVLEAFTDHNDLLGGQATGVSGGLCEWGIHHLVLGAWKPWDRRLICDVIDD